jgi:hypothetical protein
MYTLNVARPSEEPFTVTFRPLTYADRRESLKNFRQDQGYGINEYLAAISLVAVNGVDVPNEASPIRKLDAIAGSDPYKVQFYTAVFMQMFTLDDDGAMRAMEEAKKLLGKPAPSATA